MATIEVTNSSNIRSYGYRDSESVLFVEFKDGTRYEYTQVPPEIFDHMQKAESVGKFLHARVKGYYDGSKVQ